MCGGSISQKTANDLGWQCLREWPRKRLIRQSPLFELWLISSGATGEALDVQTLHGLLAGTVDSMLLDSCEFDGPIGSWRPEA